MLRLFRTALCALVAASRSDFAGRAGKRRRKAPRRQGRAVRLDLHAARCRHADGHLRQARPRDRGVGVRRRCADAAGADRRQHRRRHRLGPRHGVHGEGRAGQGGHRDGRRAAQHGGDGGLQQADPHGRRPARQEARRHHGRLAHRLDRQAHQRQEGLDDERHHRGSDRRHAAGARRGEDRPARRLYRRARDRATSSKSTRSGASSPRRRRSSRTSSPTCSSCAKR